MNFHIEVLNLKLRDAKAKESCNNDIKNVVKKIAEELNGPLEDIIKKLNIYDKENFKKSLCRHMITQLENDARIKVIRTKKDNKITEKELAEKLVEVEEKIRAVAGMVL